MKMKMFLGISMTLAALVLLAPPATAASVSHGAPVLSDFLASLSAPAPVSAAKHPVLGKSLCTATANCSGGGTVTCSSNVSTSSCSAADYSCPEVGHVTCDGVTTWCPGTCFDCSTEEQNCAFNCDPCSYRFSCDASTQTSTCRCVFRGCLQ
jgi:hypothetical protein